MLDYQNFFVRGKYHGKHLSKVPGSYLMERWEKAQREGGLDARFRKPLLNEIVRRLGIDIPATVEQQVAQRLAAVPSPSTAAPLGSSKINDTYRKLATQFHPDRGGSTVAMQALNAFRDALL